MSATDVLAAITDHLARVGTYTKHRDYLEGTHYWPFTGEEARRAREWQLEVAVLNVCPAVRGAITDQVDLTGWDGPDADEVDALNLERVFGMVIDESVGVADGYLHVWPNETGDLRVLFHRADQAGYLPSDTDPDRPRAFYKPLMTPDGHGRVNLYYRDGWVERWVTREPIITIGPTTPGQAAATSWPTDDETRWRPYEDDDQPWSATFESVGLTGLPWVHVPFNPIGHGDHGRSILADVIPLQDKLNRAETILSAGMEQYGETIKFLLTDEEDVTTTVTTAGTVTQNLQDSRYNPRAKRLYQFIARSAGQFDPPSADNLLKIKADTLANIALVAGLSPLDVGVTDLGNVPAAAALRLLASRRTSTVRNYLSDVLTPALTELVGIFGLDAAPVFRDPSPHDESEDWEQAKTRQELGYTLEDNLVAMGVDPVEAERVAMGAAVETAKAAAVLREAEITGLSTRQVIQGT